LFNEKLHELYCTAHQILYALSNQEEDMGRMCVTFEESVDAHRFLVGKPEERENSEDLGIEGRITNEVHNLDFRLPPRC
jgi:hypothetical protein